MRTLELRPARIVQARLAAGMTQAELAIALRSLSAGRLKTTTSTVSGWENGTNSPSAEALGLIAQATGRSVDFFYAEAGADDDDGDDGEPSTVVDELLVALAERILEVSQQRAHARERVS